MKTAKPLVIGLVFCLSACAGVNITPLSAQEASVLHQKSNGAKGYVVHAPVVVVEISRVCVGKEGNKPCEASEMQCKAGAPFVMPDYSRPFLVDVRSGFGKAGVDVSFTSGWLLSSVKDNSDNAGPLGLLGKLVGLKAAFIGLDGGGSDTCPYGLYRVQFDAKEGGLELARIPLIN